MDIKKLQNLKAEGKIKELPTAMRMGYVSRKIEGEVTEYKGKYGEGFVLDAPNYRSTRFSYRTYYIWI